MGVQSSQRIDGVTEIFPGYVLVPTGGKVIYVHSSGASALDQLPPGMPGNPDGFFTSINAALATVRAGRGDNVIALPGHADVISAADGWSNLGSSSGVNIIGIGKGNERPSISWTAAASSVLFDQANIALDNFVLAMEPTTGTVTVAAPITISAAGCSIRNCRGAFGTDASNKVTIGITTTAAATDLTLEDNKFYGATAAECTTFLQLVGTDRLVMKRNVFAGATSAVGVGIVRFATTASLNIELVENTYINRKALSTAAVTGLAAVSGVSRYEMFHYLDNTSTTPWITSPGIMCFQDPRVTNLAGEIGMVPTVVST